MLEFEEISLKNFLSFGNYVTTIPLSKLGQCLIRGVVYDEDPDREQTGSQLIVPDKSSTRSNGAGKSTIINAILWCLFGRTMHAPQIGDRVINWYTGKDCWVQLKFKNGDSITRTRNTDGHNELFYIKDGNEHKYTSDTLGTSKIQQAKLAKLFNLDWELLCGSAFFTQYNKPWMEMANPVRRRAIERSLHVDKFTFYAEVAKKKSQVLDQNNIESRTKLDNLNDAESRLNKELLHLKENVETFNQNQDIKYKSILKQAADELTKRNNISLPDITKLTTKWEVIKKIQAKIETIQNNVRNIENKQYQHEMKISDAKKKIKLWESKSGKVCLECEQEIPHTHTGNKVKPLEDIVSKYTVKANECKAEKAELEKTILSANTILADKKPKITIQEAKSIHERWKIHNNEVARLEKKATELLEEENPYERSILNNNKRLEEVISQKEGAIRDLERSNIMHVHYQYIHKAYNDKNKIKSNVFKRHVPYINSRLKHYLDVFGLDIHIELDSSLDIVSNKWGYDLESGGERKRTDVAFMLAMFDLHEQMYGRQCNVLVLDEVDGRMDTDGIESLISIIKDDLAPKVETVFIISHRNTMQDIFPMEMTVTRKNRLSYMEA